VRRARREATQDDSKGPASARLLRPALAGVAALGAVLLVAASFATVVQVTVLTTSDLAVDTDTVLTGFERHGPALVLLAAFALLMTVGALRGARPAAAAVAVAGLVALVLAVAVDVPALDDTRGIEELYEGASAGPKAGFYLETAGAILLLVAGGCLAALPAARYQR
jgi:hypothetical protein